MRANKLHALTAQIEQLATTLAEMRGERSTLELERRLEALAREKTEATIALAEVDAAAKRQELEIEHKLGLHRAQIESERRMMQAEAASERARAVDEAKLAVRESNLDAERKRFDDEIEFRTQRFAEEAATLRELTAQILERLPNVTATFTHSSGDTPAPRQIEAD